MYNYYQGYPPYGTYPRGGMPQNMNIPMQGMQMPVQPGYSDMQGGVQNVQAPPLNTNNVKSYISACLGMPLEAIEFVKMTEPFANSGIEARHACPVSLLAIETYRVMQLDFFGKGTIDVAYCPNCCKVLYYVEKYT